jgi:hypothetical protein
MAVRKRLLAVVLGVGVMGVIGLSARANSVVISTGDNLGWQVGGTPATVTTPPNAAWAAAGTYVNDNSGTPGTAYWISDSSGGGSSGYAGNYTFSLTLDANAFSPPVNDATNFAITGYASADNSITSVKLSDAGGDSYTLLLTQVFNVAPDGAAAWGFYRVFSVADLQNLSTPLTLTVVVNNDASYPGEPADPSNPMGFIMAGQITALPPVGASVPLPASVYSGLSMLGLLAAYKLRRKLA